MLERSSGLTHNHIWRLRAKVLNRIVICLQPFAEIPEHGFDEVKVFLHAGANLMLGLNPKTWIKAGASLLDEIEDLIVVDSPVREGIVVIRAPLLGPSYAAQTEAALKRGACTRNLPGTDFNR